MKNKKLWVSILAGIMAALMLLSLLAGLIPTASAAASSSEIKNQIEELEEEKKEIQQQMKDLKNQVADNLSEMETIVAEKNIIDQEVFLLNEQILNINEQIAAYNLLIADKQDELDEAQALLQELNEKNKERIRAMEEEGSLSYWAVLFKANSFSDLLDRLNMIEEIAAADRRRLEEMSRAAQAVADAQAALEEEKVLLEATRAELSQSQQELADKRTQADELLQELNARGEEYEDMIDAAEEDVEALLKEIAQKEEEYTEAKKKEYQQWLSTSIPPTTAPKPTRPSTGSSGGGTAGNTINGVTWLLPCSYDRFSSPYGWRIHPVYKTWKFHSGVDLGAPSGTPIYASRSGSVTVAKYSSSGGYYVTINHGDGFSSSYLHMTHYIVSVGDYVSAGQVIGYVGSTGVSTGPHLHFSIYYNGNSVNPADYINIT